MRFLVSIFLVLFVVIPLAFSLLTYALFWYETANGPHRAHLAEISRGRIRRLLARGIASSCAGIVLVILFYPFGYLRRFLHSPSDRECPLPPVILVHGLYHNSSAWTLYRLWLHRAGFKNVHVLNYNSFRRSFHDILRQIDDLARDVAGRFEGKPIVLIGHSLGGLLCRAYSERHDGVPIGAVITLGTPHHGSKLAVLGIGRLAQSLAYRGPLITELEHHPDQRNIPRLAVYSVLDNMVLPYDALKPSGPGWTIRSAPPLSHVSLLYHRKTASTIIEFVKALQVMDRTP
jgi:triacylglycerol lipase